MADAFAVSLVLLVVTVMLVLLAVVVVLFVFPWLAEENILFTKVKEGTVKAIMRGDSFERFIMSFERYHINDPTKPWVENKARWEIVYHGKSEEDYLYDDRSPLEKYLGLYWIGWPWRNSVYVYQFEWNETYTETKVAEKGKEKVLPRAEATDFIYVSDFTYAIVTESAETKDRLPTDELTQVTVAVRNPYRALFSGEDWMRRTTAAVNRQVRNFVGSKGYDELISIIKEEDADITAISKKWAAEFSIPIIELSLLLSDETNQSPLPRGLRGRYGIEIRTADLQSVELSGVAKPEHQKAAAKVYSAEQDAKATRLTGQAEADVIEMKGEKEASALRTRLAIIKDHGETGIALAGYDAVQESSKGPGNTIIWGNNPLTPLAGVLKPTGTKDGEKP